MSMVTRCPSCNTLFRVTPRELQAQQGKVRCGRCMMVFDGFKGLATLPDQTPTESHEPRRTHAATPLQSTVADEPVIAPVAPKAYSFEIESPPGFPEFALEPATPPQPVTRADAAMTERPDAVTDVVAEAPRAAPFATAAQPPTTGDESLDEKVESGPPRGSPLWAVGSVLLLFALAGQAAYLYRSELASNYPGLKPVLTQLCEAIGCSVPLPQRPKLINVEASDLEIVDATRPNMIQLTATLRNHAGYDLAYPALDLVLTNSKEHTLARRIFMPEEYLERGKNVKAGIPANAEITVRLNLDTGDLGAAGFRLDLLPAPAR